MYSLNKPTMTTTVKPAPRSSEWKLVQQKEKTKQEKQTKKKSTSGTSSKRLLSQLCGFVRACFVQEPLDRPAVITSAVMHPARVRRVSVATCCPTAMTDDRHTSPSCSASLRLRCPVKNQLYWNTLNKRISATPLLKYYYYYYYY